MSPSPQIGDRLSYDGALCTVRYLGEVAGTSGSWLGVEWDDASRGKHDGSHKGARYFTCRSRSATPASFIRPTRPAETPTSFVAALQDKYAAELANTTAIQFSGKIAEEVGFAKTRSKQAQLSELRYIVLDGARVAAVYAEGDPSIAETCPKVVELDLSRNLFRKIGVAMAICSEIPRLRELRLNGNRFQDILEDEGLQGAEKSLQGVKELALEETLMSWEEIGHVASKFEALSSLSASTNQLRSLPPIPLSSLTSTLTILNLEFNDFTTLAQLGSLASLTTLRYLHLKGNNISAIQSPDPDPEDASSSSSSPSSPPPAPPIFSTSLQYLDVSYNQIASWAFVDGLPTSFPGLTSLRFAHNPIYDDPDPVTQSAATVAGATATGRDATRNATEEAYMFTVGRLASLRSLNFGTISTTDREDAEMYYLAHIGKHLATVPATREHEVLRHHRRYDELCDLYGAPVVNRRRQINPAFLEARLVNVHFSFNDNDNHSSSSAVAVTATTTATATARVPKSFDIYAVKGVAGELFGVKPLALRLIWETGEWDPVAGFDEEVGDSSGEEEEDEGEDEERNTVDAAPGDDSRAAAAAAAKAGKWVKREVELLDGPRQLGFCVDGLEARIRVEMR